MEFYSLPKLYLLFSLSIFFLSPFQAQAATQISYCVYLFFHSTILADKKANYPVKVTGVDISPDPVKSGNPATFKIYATSGKSILGGEVVIGVSYVGVPVHTENIDLCNEVKCPVSNGNFVISHTQTLPVITPPVSFILSLSYQC
ncbi:hypothetical protein V8G54_024370 [Vigna mungo]|uniref:MD-2-related lipid-recognition domain-containing protein n=1 Tax=Vigna mungo TaxID=3915 RepID=A0AAQ3RQ24_VIGMU